MANKSTTTNSTKKDAATKKQTVTKTKTIDPRARSQKIKDIFFAVWSAVGIILIILVAIAVLGSGSWAENLNLTETTATGQAGQEAVPPPAGPTQEQLDCVSDALGADRLAELEQGAFPEADEDAVIQSCLQ